MSGASRVLLAVTLAGSAATGPAGSGTPDLAAVGLRCEYRSGRARKFTNILGEYCPFCGGKTP